jgi:hypothetical protein
MAMKTLGLASATAVVLALAGPAPAQMIDATDAGAIAGVLQGLGYRANVEVATSGNPRIRSSANGLNFSIWFYACTDGRACRSIQFMTNVDLPSGMTATRANEWNASKRFTELFLDKNGDPFLVYDVLLAGGVSVENFKATIRIWDSLMGEFKTFAKG